MKIPSFEELRTKLNPDVVPPQRLLALDPGHTLGWSFWTDGKLTQAGENKVYRNNEFDFTWLELLFSNAQPTHVVHESYVLYSWKADCQKWSEFPTVQLIGYLKYKSWMMEASVHEQTAQIAKGFCTDEKLKAWDFWLPGKGHAVDSIRHGAHFLLFGPPK